MNQVTPKRATFDVKTVPWEEQQTTLMAIRTEVFVKEQQVPAELEQDEWDPQCQHTLAYDPQGSAIGCARLLPTGMMGRVAVLAPWRRRGVGRALMTHLLHHAQQQGFATLRLHAQLATREFYVRFGFLPHGPIFEEAGILHQEMILALPSPSSDE